MLKILEISSRQSGKTQRIIDDILNKCLNEKYKPAVICFNSSNMKNVKNRLKQTTISDSRLNSIVFINMSAFTTIDVPTESTDIYFDEFDHMNHDNVMKIINILTSTPNLYFYTTPAKKRKLEHIFYSDKIPNDILIKLLKVNKYKYDKHINKKMEEHKQSLSATQYELEALANFLE
jgi:translation elongation factor P/translation initiation factor 5A